MWIANPSTQFLSLKAKPIDKQTGKQTNRQQHKKTTKQEDNNKNKQQHKPQCVQQCGGLATQFLSLKVPLHQLTRRPAQPTNTTVDKFEYFQITVFKVINRATKIQI